MIKGSEKVIVTSIRTGYCPLCNRVFSFYTNSSMGTCPKCNHHLVLHIPIGDDEDLSDGALD